MRHVFMKRVPAFTAFRIVPRFAPAARSTACFRRHHRRFRTFSCALSSNIMVENAAAEEKAAKKPPLTYSIAPMMEVTDRHFRALCRLISKKCVLYTEMVVDRTLIHNEKLRDFELRIPELAGPPYSQHPVVLQLGGSVPDELEAAARIAAEYGYTEVNLNCGCPSPKVAGKGCFGAALMRTPDVVAEATRRMASVLPRTVAVTVKCRIGVDNEDSYEGLRNFVQVVHRDGGVNHFIIHARKAILGGLSPAQNRSIPPLKYHFVHQLLVDFPDLTFSINGGFKTLDQVDEQLQLGVDGVMVGRAVMDKPWHALCDVDNVIYGEPSVNCDGTPICRRTVLQGYVAYAEQEMKRSGCSLRSVIRPILNLFHGEPNGKRFRRVIDESLRDPDLTVRDVVDRAVAVLSSDVLDAPPPSMRTEEVAKSVVSPDMVSQAMQPAMTTSTSAILDVQVDNQPVVVRAISGE